MPSRNGESRAAQPAPVSRPGSTPLAGRRGRTEAAREVLCSICPSADMPCWALPSRFSLCRPPARAPACSCTAAAEPRRCSASPMLSAPPPGHNQAVVVPHSGGSDPRARPPTATAPSKPASRRAAAPPSIHRLRVRAPPSRSASPARGCSWTTRRRTTTARTPATGRRSSPARTIRWCHPTISFSSATVIWWPGRSRTSRAAPGIRGSTSPAATRRRSPLGSVFWPRVRSAWWKPRPPGR